MTQAFFEGILLGLTLALLIGPAFFALLDTSLTRGFKFGVAFAFGIFLSDIFCVLLAYLGVLQIIGNPTYKVEVGIIGGAILIVFGLFNLFYKKATTANTHVYGTSLPVLVVKGFFLNLFNPFAILFWVGVVGFAGTRFEFNKLDIISFFVGVLLTVLFTDILKSFIARKIKNYLAHHTLSWVNKISGIILIGFGVVLIIRVLFPVN